MTKFTARMPGSRWRVMGRSFASGSNSRTSSTVKVLASQRHCGSVRTQTPMLAPPPLSPLRAPAMVPSGSRRVGPMGSGSGSAGESASASGRVAVAGGIGTRVPSACTATCSTSAAGTYPGVNRP